MKEKRFTIVIIKPLTHSKHYLFPIYLKIDCYPVRLSSAVIQCGYQVRLSVKVNFGIVQQIQGKKKEKPFNLFSKQRTLTN